MPKRLKQNLVTLEFDGLSDDRQIQLVTYGKQVLKIQPNQPRSWSDIVVDRMIIIGLVDRDSRLPTPLMALLGALIGVLFAHLSFTAFITTLPLWLLVVWIGLALAYGYLWLGIGATAVWRIRMRRAGQIA